MRSNFLLLLTAFGLASGCDTDLYSDTRGCRDGDPATPCALDAPIGASTIKAIVTSDLREEQLFETYHQRLDHLGETGLEQEFAEAGFEREALAGGRCWRWNYPANRPAGPDDVHAMAHFCRQDGELHPMRTGIRRGPWNSHD